MKMKECHQICSEYTSGFLALNFENMPTLVM